MAWLFLHLMESKKTAGLCWTLHSAVPNPRLSLLSWKQGFAPGMICCWTRSSGGSLVPLSSRSALASRLIKRSLCLKRSGLRSGSTPVAGTQHRGLRKGRCGRDAMGSIGDRQTAIEALMDLDLCAGIGVAFFARQQLHTLPSQTDRVVQRHRAHILETKDGLGIH